jgi:NhaP-type Na+/H+ or K+/H+ antiporter
MSTGVLLAFAALTFGWSLVSARVERFDMSGPIVFVLAGLVLCNGPGSVLELSASTDAVHELAELTLVLLLFADASRIDPRQLRRDAGVPIRLLAIGLPLTFAAGFGLAAALFSELPWELAALLGATLAPTDASLSASIVADTSVPATVRRALNVESGLNDGVITPVVTAFIAASAALLGVGGGEDHGSGPWASALIDLGGGIAIGAALGSVGGRLLRAAAARGWIATGGRRVAVLMLPLMALALSREIEVNAFVAAFVAGLALRTALGLEDEEAIELPDLLSRFLSLGVWFVFGAGLLVAGLEAADWRTVLYAALSLTVVRMVPVALSLVGSGTDRRTTAFIGWFGPRGLASVVFGLLIVEELPLSDPGVDLITSAIVVTVLASVLAHGISARPLVARIARGREPSAASASAQWDSPSS